MSPPDDFAGLDGLAPGPGALVTYRRWPASVKPHHPNTMAQRSRRTLYQRKDVDGLAVLALIGAMGGHSLAGIPWPVPYILVRMKVDQLERDGLVTNDTGFGNCPRITLYGQAVTDAWLRSDAAPPRTYCIGGTGTIGGRPRDRVMLSRAEICDLWPNPQVERPVLVITPMADPTMPRLGKSQAMREEIARVTAAGGIIYIGPGTYIAGKDPIFGAIDGLEDLVLGRFGCSNAPAQSAPAGLLDMAFPILRVTPPARRPDPPPKARKPHQPRQDRQKRPKAIHWRKR